MCERKERAGKGRKDGKVQLHLKRAPEKRMKRERRMSSAKAL